MKGSERLRRWKRKVRQKLYAEQAGCCKYCGKRMELDALTLDHVVPKALGGTGQQSNLVLACSPCNLKKGCKPPHVWHMQLMQKVAA